MQLLNKINSKYLNKERNHKQNMHIPHHISHSSASYEFISTDMN